MQAGSPELDAASDLLIRQGHELVSLAKRTRPDLLVQVDLCPPYARTQNYCMKGAPLPLVTNILSKVVATSSSPCLQKMHLSRVRSVNEWELSPLELSTRKSPAYPVSHCCVVKHNIQPMFASAHTRAIYLRHRLPAWSTNCPRTTSHSTVGSLGGERLYRQEPSAEPGVTSQVQRELVSGAVETEFLNTGYTNLYNNLTNVVLVVSPRAGLHEKSVLVNAHFDSNLNTAGTPPPPPLPLIPTLTAP